MSITWPWAVTPRLTPLATIFFDVFHVEKQARWRSANGLSDALTQRGVFRSQHQSRAKQRQLRMDGLAIGAVHDAALGKAEGTARGPYADSANSTASRLLKNRFSYHDARYNDLASWNSSGRCRDATIPAWWAHGNDHCISANILPALLPTRIGSVDPHALKTTARRTESTLSGNAPPLRAEAGHLRLACRPVRIQQHGARGMEDCLTTSGGR